MTEETKPCRDCGTLTEKHHNRIPMCEDCDAKNRADAEKHDLVEEYSAEHRCSDWNDRETELCQYCGETIPESLTTNELRGEEPSDEEMRDYESRQGEN